MKASALLRKFLCLGIIFAASAWSAKADLLELINGDHYLGKVVSMSPSNVVFISEIQGKVTLPREKVAQITLRYVPPRPVAAAQPDPTNVAPMILSGPSAPPPDGAPYPAPAPPVAPVDVNVVVEQMRHQGIDPKLIDQVQEQIFGKASPEASQKFNEMMSGLQSGSISVKDVRKMAQDSINQINAAKKDLGGDAGDMLNSYEDILQKFLQETQ
jgi:hypothetical protein